MRNLTAALILILLLAAGAYAGDEAERGVPPRSPEGAIPTNSQGEGMAPGKEKRLVTPYGDFCPRHSRYGVGRRQIRRGEAVEAVRAYFEVRGLTVRVVRVRGRFMVFDVYGSEGPVDRVIFDRRTGRLRSIY